MARRKGKEFQKEVAKRIAEAIGLPIDDVMSCVGGSVEQDIRCSTEAKRRYPHHTECKNEKLLRVSEYIRQATDEAPPGMTPTVVFKMHKSSKVYIILPFEDWLEWIT